MTIEFLKEFLDEKANLYEHPNFIDADPIQIPHAFSLKEDIEISGFFAASLAWGNRLSIIKSSQKLLHMMGNSPFDFVMNANEEQLDRLQYFVHRTFNGQDAQTFVLGLRHIYNKYGGLETIFSQNIQNETFLHARISNLKSIFFEIPHAIRTQKHVADPLKGSAAKRIHMYLRWMVRGNQKGVDFGIWSNISTSQLSCPLDVHTGTIARGLGLLTRKQSDQKALRELDEKLRSFDPIDPVKYDFALFGLGVYEKGVWSGIN
jgi:uncharacterized protein (TIGR02757 family)